MAWLDFPNGPIRAADVLFGGKRAGFIRGIGVNEFFPFLKAVLGAF